MKKIFLYAALICGLCSCGLDNYDAPTASLTGAVIDKETKENVPGQAQNGAKIRMYEFYNNNWSVQPNDSWIKQNGTFANAAVFTGKYKVLAEGPFETVEPVEIEISGNKELNFEVTPYLRISADAAASGSGKVTMNATVDNVLGKVIQTVEFYSCKTPYVDKNTFTSKGAVKVDQEASSGVSTYTYTFENLKPGKVFYFRVGALAVNPGGYFNYSKVLEVTVK